MNVPSLQRLTILSIVFHLTFFGASLIVLKQSSRFAIPSAYVVNLVDTDVRTGPNTGAEVESKSPSPEVAKPVPKNEEPVSPKEVNRLSKADERELQDRIAALEAKKKIARIARLTNELKSVKGSLVRGKTVGSATTSGKSGSVVAGNYIAGITSAIQRQYEITPDIVGKNLEATVLMKIMRDGSVRDARITSRSGNSTFDRCVLRAIAKASPVSPPPDGENIEVKVTFHL